MIPSPVRVQRITGRLHSFQKGLRLHGLQDGLLPRNRFDRLTNQIPWLCRVILSPQGFSSDNYVCCGR